MKLAASQMEAAIGALHRAGVSLEFVPPYVHKAGCLPRVAIAAATVQAAIDDPDAFWAKAWGVAPSLFAAWRSWQAAEFPCMALTKSGSPCKSYMPGGYVAPPEFVIGDTGRCHAHKSAESELRTQLEESELVDYQRRLQPLRLVHR